MGPTRGRSYGCNLNDRSTMHAIGVGMGVLVSSQDTFFVPAGMRAEAALNLLLNQALDLVLVQQVWAVVLPPRGTISDTWNVHRGHPPPDINAARVAFYNAGGYDPGDPPQDVGMARSTSGGSGSRRPRRSLSALLREYFDRPFG